MVQLFQGQHYYFQRRAPDGNLFPFKKAKIDINATITCQPCNNEWMSALENLAKYSMHDMILSMDAHTITVKDAASISAFMFKTTVLANHMSHRTESPFFSEAVRFRFRRTLQVPAGVQVFACSRKSATKISGLFKSGLGIYTHVRYGFEFYTCSF